MRFFNGYLLQYGEEKMHYLKQLIHSKKPFLIHEHIDMDMDINLQNLVSAKSSSVFKEQKIRAYALSLANFFFERLEARRKDINAVKVRSKDLEKSFKMRDFLIRDLSNPPTIQELAQEFGMSASKLKVLFKQVFGKTGYQYFQEYRMEKARFLIRTKDLNVSEVDYEICYSNLSHFSEAFKKQFGILPKQYMNETRLIKQVSQNS